MENGIAIASRGGELVTTGDGVHIKKNDYNETL